MKSSFERIVHCTFVLGIIWFLGMTTFSHAGGMEMEELAPNCSSSCQSEECCTCTRELLTVLQGGAATLAALVVSLGGWYLTDFHLGKIKIWMIPEFSVLRVFWTFVGGVLLPQIFMSFVLSSALCATVLQQRVTSKEKLLTPPEIKEKRLTTTEIEEKRRMAKRLSAMVVWIRVDQEEEAIDMNTFLKEHKSLSEFFADYELPSVQDALVLYSRSNHMEQRITEHNSSSGKYILCSQDWDAKNRLWKEAMLNTEGVLPRMEELETLESRTKWELLVVGSQALGYLISIMSRFASGKRAAITPVEIMSAWISIVLLVQVVIIPQLVTFCKKGICLHLPPDKFKKLVDYYERNKEQQNDIDLTSTTVGLFVLCIFFQFALFLILIPALVYEYYRLPDSALSFASIILFTILSGIAIIAFVFTLVFPAQEVLFAFSAFPGLKRERSPSTGYMPLISSVILLLGFSAYILAILETVLNWQRFHARDCYFSRILIPHLGS